MKNYDFNLVKDDMIVGGGHGVGNSAIEAFENGVEAGSVVLPVNEEVEVLAMGQNGLGISFTANRIF